MALAHRSRARSEGSQGSAATRSGGGRERRLLHAAVCVAYEGMSQTSEIPAKAERVTPPLLDGPGHLFSLDTQHARIGHTAQRRKTQEEEETPQPAT